LKAYEIYIVTAGENMSIFAARNIAQAETEELRAMLWEYLRGSLREEDGARALPGSSIRVKMWWEKKTNQ
jgi:hypothetical protein